MTGGQFERIGAFFDALAQQHGDDTRSSDFASPATQRLRFDVMADGIDFTGASVLDVGCGLGRFAPYLQERFDGVDYRGVDLSAEAVSLARERHPAHRYDVANVLDEPDGARYDVVTANGIFYLLDDEPETAMAALVRRMWELSDRTTAFTSLSTWARGREPGEFHADPAALLDLARDLTPWVVLRHDYHSRDFAMFLHREQRAPRSGGPAGRAR